MTSTRSVAVAVVLTVLASTAAVAVQVSFGSAQLEWPDGYTVTSTKSPFELNGLSGEKVLVTVMRPGKEPPAESAASEQEKLATGVEAHLRTQANT